MGSNSSEPTFCFSTSTTTGTRTLDTRTPAAADTTRGPWGTRTNVHSFIHPSPTSISISVPISIPPPIQSIVIQVMVIQAVEAVQTFQTSFQAFQALQALQMMQTLLPTTMLNAAPG
ncbi:hypothetical protein E4U55_004887 [Claviceps digitariae]|nr:hypothetical protein E4U55_004887 [Claviceps digitariae]